jgi:hypothetical protein
MIYAIHFPVLPVLRFFAAFLVAFGLPSISPAQGFLRQYPALSQPIQSMHPRLIEELTNGGYRIAATPENSSTSIRFTWLDLTAAGDSVQEIERLETAQNFSRGYPLRGLRSVVSSYASLTSVHYFRFYDSTGVLTATDTINSVFGSFGQFATSAAIVVQNAAGDVYWTFKDYTQNSGPAISRVFKRTATGVPLWEKQFDADTTTATWVIPTPDGGCLLYAHGSSQKLVKLSADGEIEWSNPLPLGEYSQAPSAIQQNAAGETFFATSSWDSITYPQILRKRTAAGATAWQFEPVDLFGSEQLMITNVVATANGDVVLTIRGALVPSGPWQTFVVRLDPAGNVIWQTELPVPAEPVFVPAELGLEDSQGNLLLSWRVETLNQVWVAKLSADGKYAPFEIQGLIRHDENLNCLSEPGETPLTSMPVMLTGNGQTYFTRADSTGFFEFQQVDSGSYQVFLNVYDLWETCFDTLDIVFPQASGDSLYVADFALQAVADCPYLDLEVASGNFRPCFSAQVAVSFCNLGTAAADSTTVTLTLDPLLNFQSASLPATVDGQTLTFHPGAVGIGSCGSLTVTVSVSCEAEPGEALCLEAHISPDALCLPAPAWSGAQLEADAQCATDSVRFRIWNRGTAPSTPGLDYVIIDEHVITRMGQVPGLAPGGFMDVVEPVVDGNALRLRVEQEPGHPVGTVPSVAIERCGAGPTFEHGALNDFANATGDPFTSVYCREVTSSYDPNDKAALPAGYGVEHFLERSQDLSYTIRFQNTGTDTAFTVLLVDTLSAWLDPTTIRPGAASHPYTWTLSGPGIVTFRFDDILLPDSNVNEPASHGFVQFTISQRPDLADGTVIENFADIYFDYNAAVRTNTVFHTISDELVATGLPPAQASTPTMLRCQPVPAMGDVAVLFTEMVTHGRFELLDGWGRKVRSGTFSGDRLVLMRRGLPGGAYLGRFWQSEKELGYSRIIWQE